MKPLKLLSLITQFILTSSLISCSLSKEYDYEDIKEYVVWHPNLSFNLSIDHFLYIYSSYCYHCNSIKQGILKFRLEENLPIYFYEFNNDIPIINNKEDMIGIADPDKIGIVGVPSMFVIEDKKITAYLLGGDEILNYLENFLPIPS